MQIYGLANGYTPDEADSPAIVVDIKVITDEDVDPHEAMAKLVETAHELINEIHDRTDCVRMTDDEKAAALSSLFLNLPHPEGNN